MNHQTNSRLKGFRLSLALVACSAALVACGGGGDSTPPVMVDPAVAMRGFWAGPVASAPDGATQASAIVMPDGTGWVVLESNTAPTAVARIPLTGTAVNATDATITGTGSYYRLSDGAKSAFTASGTASTATPGTFKGTATAAGNAASTFNWTSTAGFTTQAVQAAVAGTWAGSAGSGAIALNWTISAAGAVTGTSSTGCTYTGNVTPASGTAVYNLSVSEDCAGTVTALSGIATLKSNNLNAVFTANSGAAGGLFRLTKQALT